MGLLCGCSRMFRMKIQYITNLSFLGTSVLQYSSNSHIRDLPTLYFYVLVLTNLPVTYFVTTMWWKKAF